MEQQEIVESMRELTGSSNVVTAVDDMAPHLIDWRKRHTGTAACVVFPRSVEHVSKVLSFCDSNGIKVFPQGGNTSVCGGSVPDESGNSVLLNLGKMNRILSLNADDNSMTVEAGCILAGLQQA